MSKVNRGKDFEDCVRKAFEKVPNCSVDRIHDQTTGFAGSANISDFVIYKKPTQLYLECKTCYGNTLNFHNITKNQWNGMLEKSKIDGVKAGVMIWFIDWDRTVFIPIQELEKRKTEFGEKSVNIKGLKDILIIQVPGDKKRIFFDYDMKEFMEILYVAY